MMDLSIVLLEIAQMRQQELLRQIEAENRWRELEELPPSFPQKALNHLSSAAGWRSETQSRPNYASSIAGR